MEQKDIKLNADKRKSLIKDYRKHCETVDTLRKEEFYQAREETKSAIDSAFKVATIVVQRKYPLKDIDTLLNLQKKYQNIDVIGRDNCFFFTAIDAPKILNENNEEIEMSKHFSFELEGDFNSDTYRHNEGMNFSYAMYREEMKGVGLNPDCIVEHDLKHEDVTQNGRGKSNPYLSQCKNDNSNFLNGKMRFAGNNNLIAEWNKNYILQVIGTSSCRSRSIPCSHLEFLKFEMMVQAKNNLIVKHTKWIESIVAKVNRFQQGIMSMTKLSQVEKFAQHPKVNWEINEGILSYKTGTDIVISIDDLADSINNIDQPRLSREEKILAYRKANGIRLAS